MSDIERHPKNSQDFIELKAPAEEFIEQTEDSTPITTKNQESEKLSAEPIAKEAVLPVQNYKTLFFPICLCLLISFGGFIFGWDVGTIGGISNMQSFKNNFGTITDSTAGQRSFPSILIGLIIAIFNIGCIIGGLTLSKLADWKGRKFGIFISLFVYVIGLLIEIVHDDKWYQFFIGRIFTGLAVGSTAVLVPMFISESAPLTIRGSMIVLYQLMITLGILVGNIVNYGCKKLSETDNKTWQIPIGLGFVWALIIVVGLIFTPESAQYLLKVKNNVEGAKKSFARMNHISIEDERTLQFINDIAPDKEETEKSKQSSLRAILECFTGKPRLGLRMTIGILVMTFQQLSGINYFFYYGTSLFERIGIQDSYVTSIILSVVNFVATFGGIYFVEALGRKTCLLVGSIGMFICMTIYASIGSFALSIPSAGAIMITFTCVYIVFFAVTLGPVTFVLVSELFPMKTKATSMAICSSFNWIMNFLISLLTPLITSKIDYKFGYVFAGFLLLSAAFVWSLVPETKNKTEEDINNMYCRNLELDDDDELEHAETPMEQH